MDNYVKLHLKKEMIILNRRNKWCELFFLLYRVICYHVGTPYLALLNVVCHFTLALWASRPHDDVTPHLALS